MRYLTVGGTLSKSSTSESTLCKGMPSKGDMGKIDCALSNSEGSLSHVELSRVELYKGAMNESTLSAGTLGRDASSAPDFLGEITGSLIEGSAPTGSDMGERSVIGSNSSKRSESTSSAVDSMPLVLCSSERILSMRIPRCGESGGLGGSASRKCTSHGGALHGVTLSEGMLHSTLSAGDVSIEVAMPKSNSWALVSHSGSDCVSDTGDIGDCSTGCNDCRMGGESTAGATGAEGAADRRALGSLCCCFGAAGASSRPRGTSGALRSSAADVSSVLTSSPPRGRFAGERGASCTIRGVSCMSALLLSLLAMVLGGATCEMQAAGGLGGCTVRVDAASPS